MALIVTIVLLSSCSIYHVNSTDLTDEYYSPKSSNNEVVYVRNISRPYDVIGEVIVNTERRQISGEVIEKLKREAAILGGDAVTNIRTDATGIWKKLPVQKLIGNAFVRANFKADVVVFK